MLQCIKIFIGRLSCLRVDLHQHVAVSAAIVAITVTLCQLMFHNRLVSFFASFLMLLVATCVKEFYVDGKPDWADVVFNIIGATLIWVVFFIG